MKKQAAARYRNSPKLRMLSGDGLAASTGRLSYSQARALGAFWARRPDREVESIDVVVFANKCPRSLDNLAKLMKGLGFNNTFELAREICIPERHMNQAFAAAFISGVKVVVYAEKENKDFRWKPNQRTIEKLERAGCLLNYET